MPKPPRPLCAPEYEVIRALIDWSRQPPGALLAACERACLERRLEDLFGYFLLQVGGVGLDAAPLTTSRIGAQFIVAPQNGGWVSTHGLVADPARLPVASDSVDVAVLPHTLDFAADPHQVLREAERILIPEGRVIVIGFNPWSPWGLRRLLSRRRQVPWCGRFLSAGRVLDWLPLLGFALEAREQLVFRPPLRHQAALERLEFLERWGARWWPPLSGVYVLQAVKRVSTLTPLRPKWQLKKRLMGGGIAAPTPRSSDYG